jgi:UDP-N-acetylglucosamine:LPS N-acetylglucosamine transferase
MNTRRVLILTSSGGTAHDAAAFALRDWLQIWDSNCVVQVEKIMENASPVTRGGTNFYNWIQKHGPWIHQLYWRLMELEPLTKPGTLIFGHRYVKELYKTFQPTCVISTHPHTNIGHFDLAKQTLSAGVTCITCCTEVDGGFGFSRNWVSRKCDLFWAITPEVAEELRKRRFPSERMAVLGPLLYPTFSVGLSRSESSNALPLLVLGTGANGANNHIPLLEALRPLAGRLRIVALCGRRPEALDQVQAWAQAHPELQVEGSGFLGPEAMAELYREAWAMVARPGARTATEALLCSCVLIFNLHGTTMPQELLARRYFRSREMETCISRPEQLKALVQTWLDEPQTYRDLNHRFRQQRLHQNPDAVRAGLEQAGL